MFQNTRAHVSGMRNSGSGPTILTFPFTRDTGLERLRRAALDARSNQRTLAAWTTGALGPYVVLAPIGAGRMGEVYRPHDTRLHRNAPSLVCGHHKHSGPPF